MSADGRINVSLHVDIILGNHVLIAVVCKAFLAWREDDVASMIILIV